MIKNVEVFVRENVLKVTTVGLVTILTLAMNSCGNIKNEVDVALTVSVPTSTVFLKKVKLAKCSEVGATPATTGLESQSFEIPSVTISWQGEDDFLITSIGVQLTGPQAGSTEFLSLTEEDLLETFISYKSVLPAGTQLTTRTDCGLRFGAIKPTNIGTIPGFVIVKGYTGGRATQTKAAIALKVTTPE